MHMIREKGEFKRNEAQSEKVIFVSRTEKLADASSKERSLFENPLLQAAPRALPTLTFPFFPSLPVQKGNLTRPLADKRIPCFICLYRRSYPLDRRIIGKTDNNETRDITVNELQLLIADDFREFEFMLYTQKGYIRIEYDYELKYLF